MVRRLRARPARSAPTGAVAPAPLPADDATELAEDLLEAEALHKDLAVVEEELEVLEAEEDTIEALVRREAAGNRDGEVDAGEVEGGVEGEAGPPAEPPEALEFEEIPPEDVEPGLDEILRLRIEAEIGAEPAADVAAFEVELPAPPTPAEFVCRSCFLVKRRTQLADPERQWCRDCTNSPRSWGDAA